MGNESIGADVRGGARNDGPEVISASLAGPLDALHALGHERHPARRREPVAVVGRGPVAIVLGAAIDLAGSVYHALAGLVVTGVVLEHSGDRDHLLLTHQLERVEAAEGLGG